MSFLFATEKPDKLNGNNSFVVVVVCCCFSMILISLLHLSFRLKREQLHCPVFILHLRDEARLLKTFFLTDSSIIGPSLMSYYSCRGRSRTGIQHR